MTVILTQMPGHHQLWLEGCAAWGFYAYFGRETIEDSFCYVNAWREERPFRI